MPNNIVWAGDTEKRFGRHKPLMPSPKSAVRSTLYLHCEILPAQALWLLAMFFYLLCFLFLFFS